jgi:hypothetical protein
MPGARSGLSEAANALLLLLLLLVRPLLGPPRSG